MKDDFRVRLCSDLDYEEMVADVCYKNNTIVMITQEQGIDNMEIEIFSFSEESKRKFLLDDFLDAVMLAKRKLIETQK